MVLKPYNPAKVTEAEISKGAPSGSTGGQRRVLYVEDEDINWDVTCAKLSGKFSLQRARDASDAFKALAASHFDVILMDIQLGGSTLSGIDITKTLKGLLPPPPFVPREALKSTIPVIFVTAYQARYTREELVEAGGEGVIYKPVDFTALNLAMARCFLNHV